MDIFFVYCNEDSELMKHVRRVFAAKKKNILMKSIQDIHVNADSWAHAVYSMMMESARWALGRQYC